MYRNIFAIATINAENLKKRLLLSLLCVFFFKNTLSVIVPKMVFSFWILIAMLLIALLDLIRNKKNSLYSVILLFLLIVASIITTINPYHGNTINYFSISFLQILVLILSIQVCYNISSKHAEALKKLFEIVMRIFIIVGFIEIFIPMTIKVIGLSYYNFLINGEFYVPVSYYLGDTNLESFRSGSLFFEPLTFSFISGMYLIYAISNKSNKLWIFFVAIVHLSTMGKLPILCTFLAILFMFLKKQSFALIPLVPLTIFMYFSYNHENITENLPSMANHINGLICGLKGAIDQPLFGNGIGTAGFLVAMATLQSNSSPFHNGNFMNNGNESAVGILAFQLGLFFVFLLLLYFMHNTIRLILNKKYLYAGYTLGVVISLFLTESIIGIVVFFMFNLLNRIINEPEQTNIYSGPCR